MKMPELDTYQKFVKLLQFVKRTSFGDCHGAIHENEHDRYNCDMCFAKDLLKEIGEE